MSNFRRKQDGHQHSFSVQKGTAGKQDSAIQKPVSPLRKGEPAAQKLSLLERKKVTPTVKKQEGFSRLALLMWGTLGLLLIGIAVFAVDASGDGFIMAFFNRMWKSPNTPESYEPLPLNENNQPGDPPAKNLAWVPGGWFWMGSNDPNHPNSNPIHKVYVDGFWMGKYEVTNAEWAEFVKDTGYKTVAEKKPDATQLNPFADQELIDQVKKQPPFSLVFVPPPGEVNLHDHLQWWKMVEGADWNRPYGPKSSIEGKENYPVVHICYLDIVDYLKWKNEKHSYKNGWKYRLPTEAEWEFAARGGQNQKKYLWGDELKPGDKWLANIWQGRFPHENTKEDGYEKAAPVGSYPPNGYGVYDMAGNVWEWCHDFYLEDYYRLSKEEKNPTGPAVSIDPMEPLLTKRVQRGGSFLCDVSYCERYLTYARGKGEINSAADHTGFRIVLAPELSAK